MNVEEHFLAKQTLMTEEVTYSQDEDWNIMILQDRYVYNFNTTTTGSFEIFIRSTYWYITICMGWVMKVARKIKGYSVSLRKPNVIELHIDGWYVASSNCYDNLQSRLFELLLDKIPLTERTTKEVMELYFNIQVLFDIAKQELWDARLRSSKYER